MSLSKAGRATGVALTCSIALAGAAFCAPPDRIVEPIDPSRVVVLHGNRSPRALAQDDRGPLHVSERISGVNMLLKSSPTQAAALEKLLEEQRDPASPSYHRWLTPEQYADRFGLSHADFDKVVSWLRAQGFSVDYKSRARNWVGFSGTAGQIRAALRTEIHRYQAEDRTHYANAEDPAIPAALAPVVAVIHGLDDFLLDTGRGKLRPQFTGSNGSHALTPNDLAAIYNINPLYQAGITGAGQSIAVVGQTNIVMSDIEGFRNLAGLSANDPQMVLVPGYPDPGITNDQGEANLDLEYAGGIAPDANLLYVYAPNVMVAVQYAVDQALAPVISMSYGGCEPKITATPATAAALRAIAQQANSEGITWVASSGDTGAAACQRQGVDLAGVSGTAVNMPASIPEVTGVGGSEFNEGGGRYWSSTNDSGKGSALSYIPEMAWNDTAQNGTLASGGGGASMFFSKPAWQTGPGVPDDGARDVPDVSFSASWDHDPYALVVNGQVMLNGGTSAACPVFAGILALLNQRLVASGVLTTPGLGNINPALYSLAQSTNNIFHDIVDGDNVVPCAAGTPDCDTGSYGFAAGPGYDQATGLGSLDVGKLADQWAGSTCDSNNIATSVLLVANPPSLPVTGSTTVDVTVTPACGTGWPEGSVEFIMGQTALGAANLIPAGNTGTASVLLYGSQLAVGQNTLTVTYSGFLGFAPSSSSVIITVTVPMASSAVVPSVVPNPVYEQEADADGYSWFYKVRLTEVAGVPTTVTNFQIDGNDYSADIASWFGSADLPANGTLSADLRSKLHSVPATRMFSFRGMDGSGQPWAQQLSVPFFGPQLAASMKLSSSPASEIQNPYGDPNCYSDYPYYQQLNLQEINGYGIQLTRFLADGEDMSDQIEYWFGSWRLAPLGSLQAAICWQVEGTPRVMQYEVDGIDSEGNQISATLSVPFLAPAPDAGALSASQESVSLSSGSSSSSTSSLTVDVPSGQQWSLSIFPANQKTSWLVVSPLSGAGSSRVTMVASKAGLDPGVYTATLVFQSVNTIPQFVNVPVTFTVGASSDVKIAAVANAASFARSYAPGMILAVFGQNLADNIELAAEVPLPLSLAATFVTINGIAAPLYYASPTQLNIQIPYETAAGTAMLGVNHNGKVASYTFEVQSAAPGIFTGADGGMVPYSSGTPGSAYIFFITGEGDVTPMLETGVPPDNDTPVSELPAPRLPLTMTIGGVPVTPFFVGIPYGLVGVTQINFTLPSNVPTGRQPVVVTVGGVDSAPAKFTVTSR